MEQLGNTSRRRFLRTGSMLGLGATLSQGIVGKALAASQSAAAPASLQQAGGQSSGQDAIRPFHVNFPDSDLSDLHRRIRSTRWPERELVGDASQGVRLDTMQELARYWATEYDWRKVEARLNALPQYITEIDGLDLHFIHDKAFALQTIFKG